MEEDRKEDRTWLVVVVGLGLLSLVARHLLPGADLGDLGVVVTILVAALWARKGAPLGPTARRIAVAVVALTLLGGLAVHVLAR